MLPPGAPHDAGRPASFTRQQSKSTPLFGSRTVLHSTSSNQRHNPFAAALARSRAAFACIGVFSGAINVLTLTGSLFMLQVYDRVLPSGSTQTLVALLAIVAFLYGVQAALEAVRTRMLTRVGRRLDEDLSGPA